jgi:hypothetical protein
MNSSVVLEFMLNIVLIIGFVGWCYLFLVLLQLILCKDATQPNTSKLLNRPIRVRLRLLRRSLRDPWYKASCGVLIGVCLIVSRLGYEFIYNIPKPTITILFHGLFSPCLGRLYYIRGYKAIFFVKFGEFLAGKSDRSDTCAN